MSSAPAPVPSLEVTRVGLTVQPLIPGLVPLAILGESTEVTPTLLHCRCECELAATMNSVGVPQKQTQSWSYLRAQQPHSWAGWRKL